MARRSATLGGSGSLAIAGEGADLVSMLATTNVNNVRTTTSTTVGVSWRLARDAACTGAALYIHAPVGTETYRVVLWSRAGVVLAEASIDVSVAGLHYAGWPAVPLAMGIQYRLSFFCTSTAAYTQFTSHSEGALMSPPYNAGNSYVVNSFVNTGGNAFPTGATGSRYPIDPVLEAP